MDQKQAEQLVARYGQAVFRLAYARTGNRQDAEDVTQDTFLRLVDRAPRFRDEEHCRAWLLRVAANRAADLTRAARRRGEQPLENAEQIAAPAEEEPLALSAVLALPEEYRVPVHLFYYEELPVARIAEILHLRQGTVRTRLSRARGMLRDMLKEDL